MTQITWRYGEDGKTVTGALIEHGNWFVQECRGLEEIQAMLKVIVFLPEKRKAMTKEDKAWAEAKLQEYPDLFKTGEDNEKED